MPKNEVFRIFLQSIAIKTGLLKNNLIFNDGSDGLIHF